VSTVDLHIHSTASDGKFTPEEIVRQAAQLGLKYIALADHDSVDGIVPALQAAKTFPRLKVFPCVEVSTDVPHSEVHILGYFIDYTDQDLKVTLERFRNSRQTRAQKMIEKLADQGIYLKWARVKEIAGSGSVGRPHIAQAMLEKGYINSIREAFLKYIGRDGPAYVEREKMTPAEAVGLVLRVRGLPVLAHPLATDGAEAWITELKPAGLVGIEAYCNNYTAEDINYLLSLAQKYDLVSSGGSDFHGLGAEFEAPLGGVNVPIESAERLIALAKERTLKLV